MKKMNPSPLNLIPHFNPRTLLLLFLFSIYLLISQAAAITVPGDYATIQAAIDAANDGAEIVVSPDTYQENINFGGKNIVLRSTDPTSSTVVESTIIDGNNANSVVTFSGTELTTCVLSGFTITNGHSSDYGGGIRGNGTFATIQYNRITNNISLQVGGGLYQCHGTIQHNFICDNEVPNPYYGGGGGLYECLGTIQYNSISGNMTCDGAGLSR